MRLGLMCLVAIGILITSTNFAKAEQPAGFDTDEFVQVSNITAKINIVQSSPSLHSHAKKSHVDHSFDNIVAIGLSPVEMKNFGVESGNILTVEAHKQKVAATVFK